MLKNEILSASDCPPPEVVEVPEWPCKKIYVRVMSGAELDSYESAILARDKANDTLTRTHMLVRSLCEESGVRIFEDKDAVALAAKSGVVIDRLWDVAARVNGRGNKAAEGIEGNSASDPSGASGSNLP